MSKKAVYWVVVAAASYAEIYAITPGQEAKKVFQKDFPAGREKPGELNSDRPGRTFSRMGMERHALGRDADLHLHEIQVFANQLADVIHDGMATNEFERLVLIAAPQFLGELRKSLPEVVKRTIYKEFNKDLIDISESDRMEHISKYLDIKIPAAPRFYPAS